MKYRYLIVDDEPLARKLIASHASKIDDLEAAGECANAIEAATFLRNERVDLIFLDIQMPEVSGLQFLKTIRNPPAVILTTAFRDFALDAFELDAVDYLLKPISFDRWLKAVNKFFERQISKDRGSEKEAESFLHVKSDRQINKVKLDDIAHIESLDDYVKVHLNDRFLVTRENISTFEDRLSPAQFVRIHRSFIVNMKWVEAVSAEGVQLKKTLLPFGRVFKRSALEKLNIEL